MNATTNKTLGMITRGSILLAGLVFAVNVCSGQNVSQILQTLQTLPADQQNQLLDQVADVLAGDGQLPTDLTDQVGQGQGQGLPLGKAALNYARSFNPGRSVSAARAGEPQFFGQMFQQPVDRPDFWDRVKEVFLEGLSQAIANVFGFGFTIPTIPTAGQ